jgi:Rhodopirellula transposase DDE domain
MGIQVCANTVARLLESMDYALRVNRKTLTTGESAERDQQFNLISEARSGFEQRALPMISVDTKKRELVGNFKNAGAKWDRLPVPVNDHDFRSDAIGVAIPYGVYDLLANRGSIFVGVSHDTPAFAVRSITRWWEREGQVRYRRARQLLILADSGGSNGCRCHAWKTELQSRLCDPFGLTVTVSHYPTGASKWNPIEHRLFSEVSKNWAAEPLDSYQKILNFIRGTRTETGLAVTARLDRTHYPTGLGPGPEKLKGLRISCHPTLPRWNYTISPNV